MYEKNGKEHSVKPFGPAEDLAEASTPTSLTAAKELPKAKLAPVSRDHKMSPNESAQLHRRTMQRAFQ